MAWILPVHEPLDPTAVEAREWLLRELAKPAYADERGLLERLRDWVLERLGSMTFGGALPGWALPVALVVIATVVGLLLTFRVRRGPLRAGAGRARGAVLDAPHLGADDYRARARAALAAGDPAAATADYFRAMVAACTDRTLLPDDPGLTAHEMVVTLARTLPPTPGLASAADVFDGIVYGHLGADAADAEQMGDLDRRVAQARPVFTTAEVGS